MTFWTYLFANTVISLAVAAFLIWTKPENKAKRAEAKMRREEDLFNMMLEAAKRIDEERKPNPEFTPPPEKKPPKPPTTGSIAVNPKQTDFFIGEVRGGLGNQVLGTVTANSEGELKAKLEAFSELPSTVYRPEEEIIKRYEAVQERLEAVRLSAEKALKEQTERFEKLKAAGPAVAPDHSCGSCYWFSEGGGGKFGLCIRNDEIADRDGQKACFDPQERRSKVRPKPLGTVTTH